MVGKDDDGYGPVSGTGKQLSLGQRGDGTRHRWP